jgi:hypothetical protein
MTLLGRIFHTGCERRMTPIRAAMGLAAGALAGAGLTSMTLVALSVATDGPSSLGVIVGIFALPLLLIIWAGGLTLAAPGWWLLHVLGARCQQAAMIYGGLATFVATALFVPLVFGGGIDRLFANLDALKAALGLAAALTPAGVIVGWIVARAAYGPVVKP